MEKQLSKLEKYSLDTLGNPIKTPLEQRVKKSKFANILETMTDEEIKALGYCLLISNKVKAAIDCYSKSVEHGVQLYALEIEYNKRKVMKI